MRSISRDRARRTSSCRWTLQLSRLEKGWEGAGPLERVTLAPVDAQPPT